LSLCIPQSWGMQEIKIVSGGQTGADRAALDWAIKNNIPHGGWCPKGRKAEDGVIAACYQLRESSSANYLQRTEWNVRDSDATVVFSLAPVLSGGSKKTVEFAVKHGKPSLHLHPALSDAAGVLRRFVKTHSVRSLNVAGPRGSKEPSVGEFISTVLSAALLSEQP